MASEVITDLLERGNDDWLQLVEIMSVLKSMGGVEGGDAIRKESVATIGDLLKEGWFIAGDVIRGKGFEPWDLDPGEAVGEVNRRWDALGREPDLGDVCWLKLTESGKEELRRRHAQCE